MKQRVVSLLREQWFLGVLALVLWVGFHMPHRLDAVGNTPWLPDVIVAFVLFATALPHEFNTLTLAVRRPAPVMLAVIVNSVIVPVFAWLLSLGLPAGLRTGLVVAGAVPSTLASAAVWTRRAGGNDLIPILVTAVTNLSCFFVTPFWIWLFVAQEVEMPFGRMAGKLLVLVVVPLVAEQWIRRLPAVAEFTSRRRELLSFTAQAGILVMVAIGSRECGLLMGSQQVGSLRWGWLGLMALMCLGLHLSALWLGQFLGRRIRLAPKDWIAVGFSGSQKTLMVGLHVALSVGGGVVMLPMVAYHVIQLIADTVIAGRLRRTFFPEIKAAP